MRVTGVIQQFTTGPLASLPWHGSTVGEITQRQGLVQVRDATGERPALVPLTQGARELLQHEGTRQALRGALHAFDGAKSVGFRGFALSASEDGRAIATLASMVDAGLAAMPTDDVEMLESLNEIHAQWKSAGGYGAQNLGWLVTGPALSRDLLRAAHGRESGYEITPLVQSVNPEWVPPPRQRERGFVGEFMGFALLHELNHSISPLDLRTLHDPTTGQRKPIYALEEATAETIGHWPRAGSELARSMGLEADGWPLPPQTGYGSWLAQMRRLLRQAGIDTRDPAARAQASTLLQGATLERVPGRLAAAIVREQGLPASRYAQLRTMIRDSQLQPARVDDIVALAQGRSSQT